MVIGYLNAQAARLGSLDMAVRRDKPDAVHQMRVTVRRLRSTLQSFTAVVSGPDTKELRGELKWLVHAHLAGENGFSFGLLHERAHH